MPKKKRKSVKKKWEATGHGNEIIKGEDFYVSFNPRKENPLTPVFDAETDLGETALYGPDKIWYILNGDFRKEYSSLIDKGFQTCKEFYVENIQHRSSWSTDKIQPTEEESSYLN